jgi:hypothetical protein
MTIEFFHGFLTFVPGTSCKQSYITDIQNQLVWKLELPWFAWSWTSRGSYLASQWTTKHRCQRLTMHLALFYATFAALSICAAPAGRHASNLPSLAAEGAPPAGRGGADRRIGKILLLASRTAAGQNGQ